MKQQQQQQPRNMNDVIANLAADLKRASSGAWPLVGDFVFGGKVTDNDADATRNSFLGAWDGSTGIADTVIREQLLMTGANPKLAMIVTGCAIEFYPAAETQSIIRQIRAAGFVAIRNAEDAAGRSRVLRFSDYMDSPIQGVAAGATAEITASTAGRVVEPRPIVGGPFLLDLENDTGTTSSTYAVNAAADFLVLIRFRGILAPNSILNKPKLDEVLRNLGGCC